MIKSVFCLISKKSFFSSWVCHASSKKNSFRVGFVTRSRKKNLFELGLSRALEKKSFRVGFVTRSRKKNQNTSVCTDFKSGVDTKGCPKSSQPPPSKIENYTIVQIYKKSCKSVLSCNFRFLRGWGLRTFGNTL